ncbi:ABC transporter ATP-binding protein [Lacticaseibacillus zhaodongensis]|uniref:ABC transporter ATP-binding protein n=1 Tax=Lacticaseibacillus zhaodongensis TaxID=2668065 RepID=UPI0012D2C694|nr:ABC transporter ATP-binding protein [Lacticaseibacillus zhaodongensis]
MSSIKVADITKVYRKKPTPALNHLTLEIGNGMFGLLGKNGAGKSTLMKILTTLEQPTSGRAEICGIPLTQPGAIRNIIGYLPQNFAFYPNMKVTAALSYLATLANVPVREQRRRIEQLLDEVNLTAKANVKIQQLSGGMLQRLGIAQALINNPQLLIVDEPTAGLDPEERIRFRNLLTDFASSRTVLLSTHIVSDVEATTNRIGILEHGQLLFTGTTNELIDAATGHVFQALIPLEAAAQFKQTHQISEQVAQADQIRFRFIAGSSTRSPIAPTLEEAYLFLQAEQEGVLP